MRLARVCGGVAVAAIAMAMAGCGGSSTAGTRQDSAVTRPATTTSSSRTPVRQATGTTTPRPQTQQATQPATTAQANPSPAATTTAPGPATASAAAPKGEWRPAWWISSPVQENGTVKVAAMADDADLLEARRKAVNLGLSDLRSLVDAEENALLDADTTIDVISLPDGRYRAFVLVEAK